MKRFRLAASVIGPLLVNAAWGQTAPVDPGTVQQQQLETQRYYELQKKLQERPVEESPIQDETPKPKPKDGTESEARITVDQVRTGTSRFLKPDEIAAITKPLEGHEIGIKDLFDAVRSLNKLYRDRGCVTCQAYLPPQKVGRAASWRSASWKAGSARSAWKAGATSATATS